MISKQRFEYAFFKPKNVIQSTFQMHKRTQATVLILSLVRSQWFIGGSSSQASGTLTDLSTRKMTVSTMSV